LFDIIRRHVYEDWYHADIDRETAKQILKKVKESEKGEFCIFRKQDDATSANSFAVSFTKGSVVTRQRLEALPKGGYKYRGNDKYDSVEEIMEKNEWKCLTREQVRLLVGQSPETPKANE
jgi:hypothetical protein